MTDKTIPALACRKRQQLTTADIPDGTTAIGDAAFSLCPQLKQVIIPASVEYIGVAAFCGSGIEKVRFLGIPQIIEKSVFYACKNLKKIIVPKGSLNLFAKHFDRALLSEDNIDASKPSNTAISNSEPTEMDLFGQPIVKRCSLSYNHHDFTWAKGDSVDLAELFSGPTTLIGDPSYQFRRKCLFVFMKGMTAKTITTGTQYAIPANTTNFTRKYREKYGSRSVRIFLFVCDDGMHATFYDEVRHVSTGNNCITIKSTL